MSLLEILSRVPIAVMTIVTAIRATFGLGARATP